MLFPLLERAFSTTIVGFAFNSGLGKMFIQSVAVAGMWYFGICNYILNALMHISENSFLFFYSWSVKGCTLPHWKITTFIGSDTMLTSQRPSFASFAVNIPNRWSEYFISMCTSQLSFCTVVLQQPQSADQLPCLKLCNNLNLQTAALSEVV
jgi:hypothetical protein